MSRRWSILGVTSIGVFMVFLDGTIANVVFPAVRRSFPDATPATLSWVLNAYSIVFAALLLASGRVADVVGRRRVFHLGLAVFVGGSVLCGAAPSIQLLIAARALQAVGGAMLVPSSLALLLPAFPVAMRATAVGAWGAVGAVAAAAGPSLGSLIIDRADWRLVFYVNAPIGLVAWVLGRRILTEGRDPGARRLPDALGVLLVTAAVGLLALGIVEGPDWGWGDARVLGSLGAAAVLGPLAVLRARFHPAPVIDLALFRTRSFSVANAGSLLFGTAFAAMLLCNILFLTGVWHWSILRAGLGVTPGPLMAALTAVPSGRLADRVGHRLLIVPGALVYATGILLLVLRTGTEPQYAAVYLPAILLTGIGVGMTMPTLGSAAAASLPPALFGAGSAVAATSRQVGFVLGVAILIAIVGGSTDVALFHSAWYFIAACAVATSAVTLFMGRTVPQRLAAPVATAAAEERVPLPAYAEVP